MKNILYMIGFLMFTTAALQPVVTFGADDEKDCGGQD